MEEVKVRLRERAAALNLPSLVVAACRPSLRNKHSTQRTDTLFSLAIGKGRDDEDVDLDTCYRLASISKPVTALTLVKLCARESISLDSRVTTLLHDLVSKLPPNHVSSENFSKLRKNLERDEFGSVSPSLRQVLSHTAGLPLFFSFYYEDEGPRFGTAPDRLQALADYCVVCSRPGSIFRYSNIGYGLLDFVISLLPNPGHVTPFDDAVREIVFSPLGMSRSFVGLTKDFPHCARGFDQRTGEPVPLYSVDHDGGSGVVCSANDLLTFGCYSVLGSDADSPESHVRTMQIRVYERCNYGLGWILHPGSGGRISHNGAMGGVRTDLSLFPEDDLVVCFLCNGQPSPSVNQFAEDAVELVREYCKSGHLTEKGTDRLEEHADLNVGVSCDGCSTVNFPGPRYKCADCVDYDLCDSCHEVGKESRNHRASHTMVIVKPGERPTEITNPHWPEDIAGEWSGTVQVLGKKEVLIKFWFTSSGHCHVKIGEDVPAGRVGIASSLILLVNGARLETLEQLDRDGATLRQLTGCFEAADIFRQSCSNPELFVQPHTCSLWLHLDPREPDVFRGELTLQGLGSLERTRNAVTFFTQIRKIV